MIPCFCQSHFVHKSTCIQKAFSACEKAMAHNHWCSMAVSGEMRSQACHFPWEQCTQVICVQCVLPHDIWKSHLVPETSWHNHPKLSFDLSNLLWHFHRYVSLYFCLISNPLYSSTSSFPHCWSYFFPNQFPFLIPYIYFSWLSYLPLPFCLSPFLPSQKSFSIFMF